MSTMKRWIALFLIAGLALWQLSAQAQPRPYSQAELDALLAPVALYPDSVLSDVLVAATYPDEVREAAAWSRANPHLAGEAAVQAADALPWHPSVKALLAFPDLLARMDESPQWTADLGMAFREQEPYVMDTVQALRRRAQASGALQSNSQYSVQQDEGGIAVYPVQPQVVYVPYYDPYVVYGPWWWPAYRPVYWRPWHARPAVFGHTHVVVKHVDWHRRHVVRHGVHPHRAAPRHEPQRFVRDSRRDAHRPIHRPAPIQHHARPAPRPIVGNPVTIQSHPNPVRPLVDSVQQVHRQAQQPSVRQPQPRVEQRREHRQPVVREVHRPRTAAPVSIHNQTHPVRPIADVVRQVHRQAQPAMRQAQPRFEQHREHRQPARQQSRQNHNRRG
jgi:hypothetical protein